MHVDMYVYMYTYIYIHMYTYSYIKNPAWTASAVALAQASVDRDSHSSKESIFIRTPIWRLPKKQGAKLRALKDCSGIKG